MRKLGQPEKMHEWKRQYGGDRTLKVLVPAGCDVDFGSFFLDLDYNLLIRKRHIASVRTKNSTLTDLSIFSRQDSGLRHAKIPWNLWCHLWHTGAVVKPNSQKRKPWPWFSPIVNKWLRTFHSSKLTGRRFNWFLLCSNSICRNVAAAWH